MACAASTTVSHACSTAVRDEWGRGEVQEFQCIPPPARYGNGIMKRPLFACLLALTAARAEDALVKSDFIYETAPFPSCHASTIVETPAGLVVAFFGGTKEKHRDVGIWVSRQENGKWTAPMEAANGDQPPQPDGKPLRQPLWNPVLFQPAKGPLMLFYKCGPDPDAWWGMLTTSTDHGKTWSKAATLPDNGAGPVKNKPVLLPNGDLLCGSSTEDNGWRVHFESTSDLGKTWTTTGVLLSPNGPQITGYGQNLGADDPRHPAQSQFRHRRRHAQGWPPSHRL